MNANEINIINTLIFMLGLVLIGMTLEDLIGSIIKCVRDKTSFDFPVSLTVFTIITWTFFYGLNVIKF